MVPAKSGDYVQAEGQRGTVLNVLPRKAGPVVVIALDGEERAQLILPRDEVEVIFTKAQVRRYRLAKRRIDSASSKST